MPFLQFTVFAITGYINGDLRSANESCHHEAARAQLAGVYIPLLYALSNSTSSVYHNAQLVNIKVDKFNMKRCFDNVYFRVR